MTATWDEFERLELAVGRVTEVDELPGTRKAFLALGFGPKKIAGFTSDVLGWPE